VVEVTLVTECIGISRKQLKKSTSDWRLRFNRVLILFDIRRSICILQLLNRITLSKYDVARMNPDHKKTGTSYWVHHVGVSTDCVTITDHRFECSGNDLKLRCRKINRYITSENRIQSTACFPCCHGLDMDEATTIFHL